MPRQLSLMQYIDPATSPIGTLYKPGVKVTHLLEGGPGDVSPIYRHGAKYGNGGFTGQRCMVHRTGDFAGRRVMFRLQDHITRLLATAEALEWLEVPWNRAVLSDAMFRLMAVNTDDDYFSLVFSSGGDVGVMPPPETEHHAFINSRDFDPVRRPYLGVEAVTSGITVRLTEDDVRRRPPGKLAQAKVSSNYVDSNVAKWRALRAGCKDALLLDYTGQNLAEMSVSNIIALFGDTLISPDRTSGALDGITKQTIQTIAYELYGQRTTEEPISVRRLRDMRMMIACGTAIGAVRINQIINPNGSVLWTQPDDAEAIELANHLCADIWRVECGDIPKVLNEHPDWYDPIPQRYLDDEQLVLQFA